MSGANLRHLLAMILYMAAVVGIGIYFAGRANKDAESYFLGGRSLGPWVTAFSAEASDMSGYLLMGDSNVPALSLSDNNNEKRVSSYWVENGSYLKLRTIQFGYNFPQTIACFRISPCVPSFAP